MSDVKTIDARGLSCPQPVMLVKQAIDEMKAGELTVLVDSGVARDNVSRLARTSGWNIAVVDQSEGAYMLRLNR